MSCNKLTITMTISVAQCTVHMYFMKDLLSLLREL